jgi:glycosyltransferase involved in cell wall biosynthesis
MIGALLSILIPTVVGRESEFFYLRNKLESQRKAIKGPFGFDPFEILFFIDNKEMTIGEKRTRLYHMASGKYSVQIDDDDSISDDALWTILGMLPQNADCITYQERCDINGLLLKSNHSLGYDDWAGDGSRELYDGFHFHRTPFFKDVIKTEIAKSVPIPKIRFGEDHEWAKALKPHLKTEIHINKELYYYQHTSTPFAERYGIDK